MRRNWLGLVFLASLANPSHAAEPGSQIVYFQGDNALNIRIDTTAEGLAKVYSGAKVGFVDRSGAMAIPAEYDDAAWFSEGLAAVKIGRKWGFVDRTGAMVIPARYDHVAQFSGGLAGVGENGQSGVVDTAGSVVVAFRWVPCTWL